MKLYMVKRVLVLKIIKLNSFLRKIINKKKKLIDYKKLLKN